MSVIVNSLSLPSNIPTPAALSERPQPHAVLRSRSSSTTESRLPPRYSSLAGTLPPSVPLNALAAAINNSAADLDGAAPPMSPPRYSSVFQTGSRRPGERTRARHRHGNHSSEPDGNAPPSSFSSEPQVYQYHITSGAKTQPWATLKVFSQASATSKSNRGQKIPRFSGSDLIQGCLELNLETPQNINSINLSLRGRMITSSYDDGSCTFLEQLITSWTRANGDPRSMSPSPDNPSSSCPKKFDGKLSGRYLWPFSFPFPRSIPVPGQQGQEASLSPIPQTFLERRMKGNIQYELVLRMTHGILRVDSKLHVTIVYVPDITPAPSSILRQLAYGEHLKIPGPQVDPLGWFANPPVILRGRLFSERNVKCQFTLSLANPRSYTRGTIIPCHISIESQDIQALDALANPECIAVRLVRRVQYYEDAGRSLMSSSSKHRPAFAVSTTNKAGADGVQGRVVVDTTEVERALWWSDPDVHSGVTNSNVRQLEGEIHLNKELQPSCDFPLFKVSYSVELLPFESLICPSDSSLSADGHSETILSRTLLSHPVTVATLHGEGPLPVPFTKPTPRKEPAHDDFFVDHVMAGWRGL